MGSEDIIQQLTALLGEYGKSRSNVALGLVGAAILLYITIKAVLATYRTRLSPLARFPGPREAAISTSWLYKTMKDPFPEAIYEKLHEQYGA